MSDGHPDHDGDVTDAPVVGVSALFEAGVLVDDICWLFGLTRTQFAQIIKASGANREHPVMPDTPWRRVGTLIVSAQDDRDRLSRRVRELTTIVERETI